MFGFKRVLSLLLTLCLLPVTAMADVPDFEYEDDGVIEVSLDEEASVAEEVSLDDDEEVLNLDLDEDSEFYISDEIYDELIELDGEIDDNVDRGVLELNKNLPDNVINILLVGIDSRSTELEKGGQHGDVQIILSINKDTGSVKLSSIQRDLYVTIPGYKNKNRINVAYQYGQNRPDINGSGGQLAMRTINHMLQLNIEYYATINFYGLASIIDALGGVDMELTRAEANAVNTYLRQHPPAYDNRDKDYVRQELAKMDGVQHLDGVQAVMYARTRSVDNDFGRTKRQRKLLEVLLQNVMQDMSVMRLLDLIDTTIPYVTTNMNVSEMFDLALGLLQSGIIDRARNGEPLLEQHQIPRDGTWKYSTVTSGGSKMSVVYFLSGGLQKNVEALHEFIYGEYIPAKK